MSIDSSPNHFYFKDCAISAIATGDKAQSLKELYDADIVVIHDPQPASLIAHFPNRKSKWIWRCHITEALWKAKPVIGGNVGGIRLQVIDHKTGFLVNTPEGAANRIRYLLQHPDICSKMGQEGKTFVREKFLITRHLREYLTLFVSLFSPNDNSIELTKK